MDNTKVVIVKIASMFLVILAGWIARRRGYLDEILTGKFSSLTTDVALPCLIFAQMLETVNCNVLAANWPAPLLAMTALILGQFTGWICWRLFCPRKQAPTFIFCVAIFNWLYLPLPIVQDLYHADGVALLLLCNAGVQLLLWTMGVATLHGGRLDRDSLLKLLKNPGLIATVSGISLAICGINSSLLNNPGPLAQAGNAIVMAIQMIGTLTVPLSLLVAGAQLGAMPAREMTQCDRPLIGLGLVRLIVTPLLAMAIIWLLICSGISLPGLPLSVAFLLITMPVAVSGSILTERFGQDTSLAARSIFYTTLASLVTVPALFALYTAIRK